jgi:hypothetical protein
MSMEGDAALLFEAGGLRITRSSIVCRGIEIAMGAVSNANMVRAPDWRIVGLGAQITLLAPGMFWLKGRLDPVFDGKLSFENFVFVVVAFGVCLTWLGVRLAGAIGVNVMMKSGDKLFLGLNGFSRAQRTKVKAALDAALSGMAPRAG